MARDESAGTQLEQWISLGATIVAPVTVLGALLFYFGYVSSAAEYAYFGINVDTIGLNTQAYIMRSPQTLLVPLLTLTLGGAGFLSLNVAVNKRIAPAVAGATGQARRIRYLARMSRIPGLVMLVSGVLLLFLYAYVRDWSLYGLITPLLIGFGAAVIAYASRVLNLLERAQGELELIAGKVPGTSPATTALPMANRMDVQVLARRTVNVLICIVIAASAFWATATIAQWSGRGLAQYTAVHFDSLPSVILDSKERLFLRDPGIQETVLPPSQGQTFHYRYRGLRLLIQGQDRMFLVPEQWSASDSTLIVPLDDSVRVQFQFQNQPP